MARKSAQLKTAMMDWRVGILATAINQLKGKVTMVFITHALPKNLQVDEVVRIGWPLPSSILTGKARMGKTRWCEIGWAIVFDQYDPRWHLLL